MNVLLHQSTQKRIEAIRSRPKNAYIFYGAAHIGKYTAALELAAHWADVRIDLVSSASDIWTVVADKNSIGIARIADVIHNLQLSRSSGKHRTVIIDDGELLTSEAQNSLLKIIEDAPPATTIIFIASNVETILTTVRSRCVEIYFAPPPADSVQNYLLAMQPAKSMPIKALIATGGLLPGQAISLLADDSLHSGARQSLELASEFLQFELFDRLVLMSELAKDSPKAKQFVVNLAQVASQRLRGGEPNTAVSDMAEVLTAIGIFHSYEGRNVGLKPALDMIAMSI